MIQFSTLKITSDGQELLISAYVPLEEYYDDVLIESIAIDTQDTFNANGVSSNPIYRESFVYTDPKTLKEVKGRKEINLVLNNKALKNISLQDNILYIYLIASGTPAPNTPCGMDNATSLGVVCSLNKIYSTGLKYLKEVSNNCSIPQSFIDFICQYKALDLAIRTKNYIQANKYWNKFFKGTIANTKTSGCGCTG